MSEKFWKTNGFMTFCSSDTRMGEYFKGSNGYHIRLWYRDPLGGHWMPMGEQSAKDEGNARYRCRIYVEKQTILPL